MSYFYLRKYFKYKNIIFLFNLMIFNAYSSDAINSLESDVLPTTELDYFAENSDGDIQREDTVTPPMEISPIPDQIIGLINGNKMYERVVFDIDIKNRTPEQVNITAEYDDHGLYMSTYDGEIIFEVVPGFGSSKKGKHPVTLTIEDTLTGDIQKVTFNVFVVFSTYHMDSYDYSKDDLSFSSEVIENVALEEKSSSPIAVDISPDGSIMAVGYSKEEKVSIYSNENGQWEKLTEIHSPIKGTNRFGMSVAVSNHGDTLVVGAPKYSYMKRLEPNGGSFIIYKRKQKQDTDTEQDKDTWVRFDTYKNRSFKDQAHLGWGIDISNDGHTIAVSEPYKNLCEGGVVVLTSVDGKKYKKKTLGSSQTMLGEDCHVGSHYSYVKMLQKRTSSFFGSRQSGELFGFSFDLSPDGNFLAIGAPGKGKGYVEIYRRRPNTRKIKWDSIKKIDKPDGFKGVFGESVALSNEGETLAVGQFSQLHSESMTTPMQLNSPANNVLIWKKSENTAVDWKRQENVRLPGVFPTAYNLLLNDSGTKLFATTAQENMYDYQNGYTGLGLMYKYSYSSVDLTHGDNKEIFLSEKSKNAYDIFTKPGYLASSCRNEAPDGTWRFGIECFANYRYDFGALRKNLAINAEGTAVFIGLGQANEVVIENKSL